MMNPNPDRLYDLLPAIYRLRDAGRGYPLRGLLRVIAEQVNLVEADIARLYENWFIETCQDWVVPYIGDLIGYTPIQSGDEASDVATIRGQARSRLLIPRQEVARTIHYRRRKGTVSLLEDLAQAVAGWPARAIEFYRLLGVTQNINHLHLDRGRTADLRDGGALEHIDGPFAELAHTVDIRSGSSPHRSRIGNIPRVGVYVWRLRSYSVTVAPAFLFEAEGPNCFLFSPLGNDTQLYTRPELPAPHPPGPLHVPASIGRRDFESGIASTYGEGKSLEICVGSPRQAIAPENIVAADLRDWSYRPSPGQVAVDPRLGRIVFHPAALRRQPVWVSYHYGFSADLGGGEYERPISQPPGSTLYRVGEGHSARIVDALALWQKERPPSAVIEITDSGVYVEQIAISLAAGQNLQIRAAKRCRPVLRLLDLQTSQPGGLVVGGDANTHLVIDGLTITGRAMTIESQVTGVTLRHSTLVPGWALHCNCEPHRPTEPSLELADGPECLRIEHSIIGSIRVSRDRAKRDPLQIHISDSIVDATDPESVAVGAPEKLCAEAALTVVRSTVIGQVQAEVMELGENSLFLGAVVVCRSQQGCMRFCYAPPGSRTPRRYHCQPDLVRSAVQALFDQGDLTAAERDQMIASEQLRVEPEFTSTRYGTPGYCQLADACATEITAGADDGSEMGVFHDLYQPQRLANLRVRLDEFTPAGMSAEIIYAS